MADMVPAFLRRPMALPAWDEGMSRLSYAVRILLLAGIAILEAGLLAFTLHSACVDYSLYAIDRGGNLVFECR